MNKKIIVPLLVLLVVAIVFSVLDKPTIVSFATADSEQTTMSKYERINIDIEEERYVLEVLEISRDRSNAYFKLEGDSVDDLYYFKLDIRPSSSSSGLDGEQVYSKTEKSKTFNLNGAELYISLESISSRKVNLFIEKR